jgi:predicted metal-dependent hydrolase
MKMTQPYRLVRSKRKSVALVVTTDATLVVRAPLRTSLSYIERLLEERAEWIHRAMRRMQSRPQPIAHRYVEGEVFLYLGEAYPLRVVPTQKKNKKKKLFFEDAFILNSTQHHRAHDLFVAWYKAEAKKRITERVAWWAGHAELTYASVKINSAKGRWGSCSVKGNLNFSWRLIMAPLSVIDYVVVHELAHLTHKNHSKAFWHSVMSLYPATLEAKKWLRKNGETLTL